MTLNELKIAVLIELGIVAGNGPAAPEDAALVGSRYTGLHDMLLSEDLATWSLSEDVPDYAAQPLTWMLSYLCARAFGLGPIRVAELEQLGALNLAPIKGGPSLAERQLRRQLAKSSSKEPVETEYF